MNFAHDGSARRRAAVVCRSSIVGTWLALACTAGGAGESPVAPPEAHALALDDRALFSSGSDVSTLVADRAPRRARRGEPSDGSPRPDAVRAAVSGVPIAAERVAQTGSSIADPSASRGPRRPMASRSPRHDGVEPVPSAGKRSRATIDGPARFAGVVYSERGSRSVIAGSSGSDRGTAISGVEALGDGRYAVRGHDGHVRVLSLGDAWRGERP